MFVNAREPSASIRGASGHARLGERVRDAVGEQRLHAGPRGEDLERRDAARGGVAGVGGGDVAPELAGDAAQGAETEHATEG